MNDEATTIAIIEDDPDIADLLNSYLRKDGYRALIASDVEGARRLIRQSAPKLILLDLGLPGDLDGIDLLGEIRATQSTPVMVITARDGEVDRILGLELGADDYVTKPFSPREVVARIHAILRRVEGPQSDASPAVVELGAIAIDTSQRKVTLAGAEVPTTPKEFDLICYLAHNRGVALTRDQILEAVWGIEWYGDERTIDVHIRQLRRKLGDALHLSTLWGVGYRLDR